MYIFALKTTWEQTLNNLLYVEIYYTLYIRYIGTIIKVYIVLCSQSVHIIHPPKRHDIAVMEL